jgi:diguanylate cyclase (GGDEF)-like protein/PAS domain S-box-containing protein
LGEDWVTVPKKGESFASCNLPVTPALQRHAIQGSINSGIKKNGGKVNKNGSAHLILSPGRIAMLYAVIGLCWVIVSDVVLIGATSAAFLSILKGCLFVMVSTSLLYALISYYSREVKLSRDIFYKAFQISPDSININRLRDGAFIHVNEGFSLMSGYDEAEVIGKTPQQIKLWRDPEELLELAALLERCGAVDNQAAMFRKKDGSLVSGMLSARLIELYGEKCVITMVRDISELLKAEEEIQQLVYYDAETTLPNQNLLMDRLNQAIALASRENRTTALIYVGLSGFTNIVDALGHGGSGSVARIVAERLASVLRQSDTLARISRDEFAIVLGGSVVEADITMVLHKLQSMFSEPVKMDQGGLMIAAAIGVACYPPDGLMAEILLQHAHIAMNQARDHGSNCFKFFSTALNSKAQERHRIETHMLRGLEQGEFHLCYQPKLDINGKDITGMEALIRWDRPGIGMIPPDRFIPVAEENGMIMKLGEWVLRTACRQNRAWQEAGLPLLPISVNISARQLRDNGFVDLVTAVLHDTGLSPRHLDLELTESVIMSDPDITVSKLLKLKELGISISVDDFGTGYSSLSYLKHLPIDCLKIDRSFVMDIASDTDDAAIVTAVIAMAHSLNLKVIAEGVETGEQLAFLEERKCNEVQGYYFSKPLQADSFENFLRQGITSTSEAGDDPGGPEKAPLLQAVLEIRSNPLASAKQLEAVPVDYIGDVSTMITPVLPSDNLNKVLKRFQAEKELLVLPVVDNGHVAGIVNRSTFLEEHIIGRHGFAFHINHAKKIRDLMLPVETTFEATTRIDDASRNIQALKTDARIDNICITRNGSYVGILDVNRFISAVTERNLTLAKGANPLSGLPGNESIQRVINDYLSSGKPFDIAYIDIDNFKPYNDYYGFQKGDVVIKALAEIIVSVVERTTVRACSFYGHIGGDDFILITTPNSAPNLASLIIREFEGHLAVFHGENDYQAQCYTAVNRKAEKETFGLLSLSFGILNTLLMPIKSYAQLASLATEVKSAAKGQPGSSIVINKRLK